MSRPRRSWICDVGDSWRVLRQSCWSKNSGSEDFVSWLFLVNLTKGCGTPHQHLPQLPKAPKLLLAPYRTPKNFSGLVPLWSMGYGHYGTFSIGAQSKEISLCSSWLFLQVGGGWTFGEYSIRCRAQIPLKELLCQYGIPHKIILDNRRQFQG